MIGELAARQVLPKNVVDGVTERAGGVPLFVEEVTRLLFAACSHGGNKPSGAARPTLPDTNL
jgi:hypothetical protein